MTIGVAGHRISLVSVLVAVLQVVAVLCDAEAVAGPKARLRGLTDWTFLAATGAISTLVCAWLGILWFGLDSSYLGASILIGIASGLGGGVLPRWVSDLSDARTRLPEMQQKKKVALTGYVETTRTKRVAEQSKRTLQSKRQKVRERIAELQSQIGISRGRAKRDKDLLVLLREERELDKLLATGQRRLRDTQRSLESIREEYVEAALHVNRYESINRQFDEKFSISGMVATSSKMLILSFLVGGVSGFAATHELGIALVGGLIFALSASPLFRLVLVCMLFLGTMADRIGDFGATGAAFSLRGFAIAFILLLFVQEINFMLPPATPAWTNALFALILALGGGVAGGFSRAVGNAVGRLTKQHFALAAIICHCTVPLMLLIQGWQ